MASSLEQELQFLSTLLSEHPNLIVSCSDTYFRIEVRDVVARVFSATIPQKYPFSVPQWQIPVREISLIGRDYEHSLSPLSAGVYEILKYYSVKLRLQAHISSLKDFIETHATDLILCSPLEELDIGDSFEVLSDASVGSFEDIQENPLSIESLDSSSDIEDTDGYESDSTIIADEDDIPDSVFATEPAVQSKPIITTAILESFGMSPVRARSIFKKFPSCLSYLRLCTELSYIHASDQYNGSCSTLQLRVLNNDIYKWQLKIWQFPDPCHLNTELLEFSPTDSCVTLDITFSTDYPFCPPFLRIVSPPIKAGHVIMGGAIFLDVLLPGACKMLGSSRTYSPCIQLKELFTQVVYSMVDGNAHVLNSPSELDTYTYDKAYFVYHSMVGMMTVDWDAVIKNVMGNESTDSSNSYTPSYLPSYRLF